MSLGHDGRRGARRTIKAVLLGAAAAAAIATVTPQAIAADAAGAIHPGVMTTTNGAQCTANFVFTRGADTFIGQAAHCSGTGSDTDTDGCKTSSLPIGTPVTIAGASKPGTLAYNSWVAMKSVAEGDANACAHNDLALVKIDPADVPKVTAAVPFYGGPKGIATTGTQVGQQVNTYGNSKLRGGVEALSPKTGVSLGDADGGWTRTVMTVSPGIPGDSGSAFLTQDGMALGVLSTLNFAPEPGTNGVSDLNKMLQYAASHGMGGLTLRTG